MSPSRTLRLLYAAVAASGSLVSACHGSGPGGAPPAAAPRELRLPPGQAASIRTEQVARAPFRRVIEATGTVAFDQDLATQVLAPFSGPVTKILATVGARVRAGEALALVASPDFAADVSALRKAEAAAKNARRIADLDQQLFANDAIARRDVEQAETDAVAAAADRDAALEQLRSLGVDDRALAELGENKAVAPPNGVVRAPLAGTVVEKLVSPGQLLQAGVTPCFTVADTSRVWVLANVFEADLPFVAVGDAAEVSTEGAEAPLPGSVEYISALVDPATRAIAVRLGVANPGDVLKRDLYVRVSLRSRRASEGILVPIAAVLRDEESLPFVFLANSDGSFARRRVELGARSGDRQEIVSGLAPGDSVVVDGGLYLQSAESQ